MYVGVAYNTSMGSVLDYHDEKLQDGRAQFICGANFIRDADRLNRQEKIYHFQRLIVRNQAIRRNVLHLVVRFGWRESVSNDTMAQIAREYMDGMGFGKQPYLVYRHFDSPYTHAHIVSTAVGLEGQRMSFTKQDLQRSQKLSRELEKKYGLQPPLRTIAPGNNTLRPGKVQAGKMPLYPAMSTVLDTVVPNYHYTNLGELNAVLAPYNIRATRGSPRSVTYLRGGMHYQALNDNGKPTGAYVRASAFRLKPTWKNLQSRFLANVALREPNGRRITTAIDFALTGSQLSFSALREALAREKIAIVVQRDLSGALHRLWYIDHHTRAVFEDKSLGSNYLAGTIERRTISEEVFRARLTPWVFGTQTIPLPL